MIEFHGQLDEALYRSGLTIHARRTRALALMILACMTYIAIAEPIRDMAGWHVLIIGGAVYVLVLPWLHARTVVRTSATFAAPQRGFADEEEFRIENDFTQTRMPWAKFHRRRLEPEFAMLYLSAFTFYVVSRSSFASDADWNAFTRLVQAKVKHAAGTSSPVVKQAAIWFGILVLVFLLWKLSGH